MEYLNLIKPELLILVPFLYGVGYLLSKIPKMKDWSINILLTIVSVGFTIGYMLAFAAMATMYKTIVMAAIQGVFIAMATITSEKILEGLIRKHSVNTVDKSKDDELLHDDEQLKNDNEDDNPNDEEV